MIDYDRLDIMFLGVIHSKERVWVKARIYNYVVCRLRINCLQQLFEGSIFLRDRQPAVD